MKYFWKPSKDTYKSMVSKEQEHSSLTPIKNQSSLPEADKYRNWFWARWCKKPLVEIHCPLEDQTQKTTPQILQKTSLWGAKSTKTFHLNGKSHLVITLSLELVIWGSSPSTWEPLQASYFHFTSFAHTTAHSSGVCSTSGHWRSTAHLWTIFPKERERLASVPIWGKLLPKCLSSLLVCITISRKILPSHIQTTWCCIQQM